MPFVIVCFYEILLLPCSSRNQPTNRFPEDPQKFVFAESRMTAASIPLWRQLFDLENKRRPKIPRESNQVLIYIYIYRKN